MSKILKRPMFRKGGPAMEGVMKLASGGRAHYAEAGPVKQSFQDLIKDDPYLQEVYDIAQAGFGRDIQQERSDVLANLLIRGGLGLVSGEGAGKGTLGAIATAFQKPTEQALTEMAALKQDPAKMLTAKTAITQKGQERLKLLELQNQKIDAEKKARVMLGPDASPEEIRKKAAEILDQSIFGVQRRSEEGIKQGEVEIIAKQSKVDLPTAKIIHNLQQNAEKIKKSTGLELGPNNGIIYGQKIKGKLDYTNEARNSPDGIYFDPQNRVYVKIQSGIAEIIADPLSGAPAKTSALPKTEEPQQTASTSNRSFSYLNPNQKEKLKQIQESSPEDFGLKVG